MILDVLAFAAHPDDVELACSGTLMKLKSQGKNVGVVDLTKGELGTRGTIQTRKEEAQTASEIMNLDVRDNLGLADGLFELNTETRLAVVRSIRKYKPSIVLANATDDRHIDHPKASQLVKEAVFLAGLAKIETKDEGEVQAPWRVKHLFNYIQHYHITPDFVVDVTPFQSRKIDSILAYKTQFYNPENKGAETPISSKRFLDFLNGRAREMGESIGVEFGEGFTSNTPLSYDLVNLL